MRRYTVTNLSPYSNYNMVIKAYNNNGEGPASSEVSAKTLESGKTNKSSFQAFCLYAKYVLV